MNLPATLFRTLLVGLFLLTAAHRQAWAASQTALDKYIAAPDTNFTWTVIKTVHGDHFTTAVLEMTSQSWLTTNEVDRPLWKHWMTITTPDKLSGSTALLFIGGGDNNKPAPDQADGNMIRTAMAAQSVVCELKNVPNQPLTFNNDGHPRVEDDLVAYTWDEYLHTGDERWPARLPMTKSAVRAMDAVTAYCAGTNGGGITIDGFVVAGASKRGWTTWTTAAVDPRVKAIVPCVIDLLNIEPSFKHHWEAYGEYAPAVQDYVKAGIMEWQGTKQYRNLMEIVEPYEYRDRFTMPKFIINATGDQFFLPDSSQFYFQDLPGAKYLRYVPNTDHSLKKSDALETLVTCFYAVINKVPLPQFTWSTESDGALRVTTQDKPGVVKLWQANNPKARDFRLDTIGPVWTSTDLKDEGDGVYVGRVPKPDKGWTAYMVELTFPRPGLPAPFKFTTQVNVIPNVTAFKFKPKETRMTYPSHWGTGE